MAEKLCANALKARIDAKWYLEESHNHPVHPKLWLALKGDYNFAEECLYSWSSFVEKAKGHDTLHILDGSAFQSTVRFMMEKSLSGIEDYFRRFEDIVSVLEPRMLYMRPCDVVGHSKCVCAHRGEAWSTKVSVYLTKTNYAVCHELIGIEGMHRFWNEYAQLCDRLVLGTSIPTRTIRFVQGEWERHMAEATTFLGLNDTSAAIGEEKINSSLDTDVSRQSAKRWRS